MAILDLRRNPFSPGIVTVPPELVDREAIIAAVRCPRADSPGTAREKPESFRLCDMLGFTSMHNYWQFGKTLSAGGEIHVDLLAADVPLDPVEKIHGTTDQRRLRPHGFDRLHARRTPEPATIQRCTSRMEVRLGDYAHTRQNVAGSI